MPIYEYKCNKCDQSFEQLVASMSSKSPVACPHCGSKQTVKQLSVFAARDGQPKSPPAPAGCQSCCQSGACPYQG